MFEVALIEGLNDSPKLGREIGRLLKGFPCLVNLIPLNPVVGLPYRRPAPHIVAAYERELVSFGVEVATRNHLLRLEGREPARDFAKRLQERLTAGRIDES